MVEAAPSRSQRIVRVVELVAWLFLAVLVVENLSDAVGAHLFPSDPVAMSSEINQNDRIDIPLILHSVQSRPTFASTFAWWHSSWVKEVPFWRPLTIQMFWLEAHSFTTQRYDLWFLVTAIGHLAMLAALVWMVLTLTSSVAERPSDRARGKAIVWLTIWIFAAAKIGGITPTFLADLFTQPFANVALDVWKNQPDILADLFVFLSLAFSCLRRWWPSIGCAFIAVAFKETGWMAWALDGWLLIIRGDWRRVPASVYVGAAVSIVVLLGLRWASGPEVFHGFRQGSNGAWFSRYESAVGGSYIVSLLVQPYCFIMGHVLFVFGWLRSRGRALAGYLLLAGGLAVALSLQAYLSKGDFITALVSYVDFSMAPVRTLLVIGIYLQLCGFCLVMQRPFYRRIWLFAAGASAVTALPYVAASQVQIHALHLAYAFESVAWATIFVALIDCWRVHLTAFWKALRTSGRSAEASTSPSA